MKTHTYPKDSKQEATQNPNLNSQTTPKATTAEYMGIESDGKDPLHIHIKEKMKEFMEDYLTSHSTPRGERGGATPIFASAATGKPMPVDRLNVEAIRPEVAYQMIKEETYAQTRPELNLATFVTTYMDDYATRLMNDSINVNYIDETEYPRIALMSGRCINILANLWNTPQEDAWKTGALAGGSSEACMLGGVAAWLRWKAARKAAGKPYDKPNFVISSGLQVVWEKFSMLWQIEMRTVPLSDEHITLDANAAISLCDENTICIVAISGVTWTGLNDDVESLDKALEIYNTKNNSSIAIHVDAATGGFILPFTDPKKRWDFRLKWVYSISTSGHKFGLVYPGLGWVVWRNKESLPEEMSFSVNYLGANITQVGLNFSRPAAQVLGQYYQFLRLGYNGYAAIQSASMEVAMYLHSEIGSIAEFSNYSDEVVNPLFVFSLEEGYSKQCNWTLYDLQARLQQSGWMVPAYSLPDNLTTRVVMRIVARQGFTRDMADMLLGDIRQAVAEFRELHYPTETRLRSNDGEEVMGRVATHTK
ncbi:MAG: glutamate decarboxylase [Rikenellaceae bacterium]